MKQGFNALKLFFRCVHSFSKAWYGGFSLQVNFIFLAGFFIQNICLNTSIFKPLAFKQLNTCKDNPHTTHKNEVTVKDIIL